MPDDPNVPNIDEFEDPLENYDPKTYKDPLEQALADETVEAIRSQPFLSAKPDLPVHEALELLDKHHIACMLIEEDGKLTGVFSDRDALDKVALEYDRVKDLPVSEVMTTNPIYIYEMDSSAAALSVMAVSGYRHVPVLDLDEKIVGIISPQRVTEFLQKYFEDAGG